MPEVIQFESDQDRVRAIDVLLAAGETYTRVPSGRFLVSDGAICVLREQDIRFRVLGKPTEEKVLP